MDATALYAYRYLDTYFIFPGFNDGYPSALGTTLVNGIPTEPEKFDDWLKEMRKRFGCILEKRRSSDPQSNVQCYCKLSCEAPMKDERIQWVYIIDLDRLMFSVDNGAHFKLDSISHGADGEEWIQHLGQDGMGRRCIKLSTPRTIVAEMYPRVDPDAIVEDTVKYHSLNASVVNPEEWTKNRPATEFASQYVTITALKALIGHFYSTICNACQYEPTDVRFQRSAGWLLRAAAPNFLQLRLDEETSAEPISTRPKNNEDDNVRGQGVFYWFRGCLILLSTRLDSETHLRANIVRVASRVREKGIRVCTALIWSIRHVVVVRITDDRVSHSTAQPVLAAYGIDDVAFSASVRLMAYFLGPMCPISGSDGSEGALDEASCANNFTSRGSTSERQAVRDDMQISLPTDIILEIMKFVDIETYSNVFSRLTAATRNAWMRRPRIGSYTICGNSGDPNRFMYFGHIENGSWVHLNLIYDGHPFLDNRPPKTFHGFRGWRTTERVNVRWPPGIDEGYEKFRGMETWDQVRHCGLYLEVSQ